MPEKKLIIPKNIRANLVKTIGLAAIRPRSPDDTFEELFHSAQTKHIFGDNKVFVDLVPKKSPAVILKAYQLEKRQTNFDLEDFIGRNFHNLAKIKSRPIGQIKNPELHIKRLWPDLTVTNRRNRGSLLALPYEYVVPGGRFQEQFYWDSYFIMLGLAKEKQWRLIEGMMKNYTYMIRRFGFIPTANRSYFLSRSQPPFFSYMVELLREHRGDYVIVEYLPYLLKERQFWMRGGNKLGTDRQSNKRVVRLSDRSILNRYYDDKSSPRPESYIEDISTAANSSQEEYRNSMYLNLRAAAESGWDFSSRWFTNPNDISTICTTNIIPVDLNCLLYHLESTIAEAYRLIKQKRLAKAYEATATNRANAIKKYCWDEQRKFFYDYDFIRQETAAPDTLAAVFPLYVGLASKHQADAVASKIEQDFLKNGGLLTTLVNNGQQWDAPNGWAPLNYIAIKALERYGYHKLADIVKQRWLQTNQLVFERHHKFIEKYDVVRPGDLGGGGEYALQDGFGWTNGVFETLMADRKFRRRE